MISLDYTFYVYLLKGKFVTKQFVKIFVVAITLFATAAPCFCWVQMASMPGCHSAVMEMKDCCCSTDATVDHNMPERDLAVLPAEWQSFQLDVALLSVSDASFVYPSSFLSSNGNACKAFLRSPPDLYLLHATFLI